MLNTFVYILLTIAMLVVVLLGRSLKCANLRAWDAQERVSELLTEIQQIRIENENRLLSGDLLASAAGDYIHSSHYHQKDNIELVSLLGQFLRSYNQDLWNAHGKIQDLVVRQLSILGKTVPYDASEEMKELLQLWYEGKLNHAALINVCILLGHSTKEQVKESLMHEMKPKNHTP